MDFHLANHVNLIHCRISTLKVWFWLKQQKINKRNQKLLSLSLIVLTMLFICRQCRAHCLVQVLPLTQEYTITELAFLFLANMPEAIDTFCYQNRKVPSARSACWLSERDSIFILYIFIVCFTIAVGIF